MSEASENLIARFVGGCSEAADDVTRQCRWLVAKYGRGRIHEHEIDDVVQEVVMYVFKSGERVYKPSICQPSTWLGLVVRSRLRLFIKKQQCYRKAVVHGERVDFQDIEDRAQAVGSAFEELVEGVADETTREYLRLMYEDRMYAVDIARARGDRARDVRRRIRAGIAAVRMILTEMEARD